MLDRWLACLALLAFLFPRTGHAQTTLVDADQFLRAEVELVDEPYSSLAGRLEAGVASGTMDPHHEAYLRLLVHPESFHQDELAGGKLVRTRREGDAGSLVDGCPGGELECVQAFWKRDPQASWVTHPTVRNGVLVVGATNFLAWEALAWGAGSMFFAPLSATVGAGGFMVLWKLRKGVSPAEEAAEYGRDIDQLLGRSWFDRNLNSYRYTFEGVLRTAWALRDSPDPIATRLARRILLLDGASRVTENCGVSLWSLWDPSKACRSVVVGRALAWRTWLALMARLNKVQGWGLDMRTDLEGGRTFRKHFPSLGSVDERRLGVPGYDGLLGQPSMQG